MTNVFYAHSETALRRMATGTVVDGRLRGRAPFSVADLAVSERWYQDTAFALYGPGDVERLAPGAITRRFPAPGAGDAEETKLPLVEFGAVDLPWRYTPRPVEASGLRPWLVLVVGRRNPDGLSPMPDGTISIGVRAQEDHPLDRSALWAHVHEVDGRRIARIVSPVNLAAEAEYLAAVVPAFTPEAADAWDGSAPVRVPCYDRWSFTSGPAGDFPDLAAQLHKADLAAIETATGRPFGRATVVHESPSGAVDLYVAGALRLPPGPGGPDPTDAPVDPGTAAQVAALTSREVVDGRPVVTPPRYPDPFTDAFAAAAAVPGSWPEQIAQDPRIRGAAGLGAWAAIEWQDRIADAAAVRAGDLAIARDRIRHVALGVEVSRSLWERKVPADPTARLAVLGSSSGRLSTERGSVLDRLGGRTPGLGRALFSSAARRALRPGPARTARAQAGATSPAAVLDAANRCPEPGPDPVTIGHADVPHEDVWRLVDEAIRAATHRESQYTQPTLDRIRELVASHRREVPTSGEIAALLAALAPGPAGLIDRDRLTAFFAATSIPDIDVPRDPMGKAFPAEPCTPVDVTGVCGGVSDAIDPTADPPPVTVRVVTCINGVTDTRPVEIDPELDIPLWSFLTTRAPDWMLPGVGDLGLHQVVGLSTNPAFVQAMLTGANHQAAAELRWRDVPMRTRWSPLRQFWQRPGFAPDIHPIRRWPGHRPYGSSELDASGRSAEAVVAFRTPLFRRYPSTVVYLYRAADGFVPPPTDEVLARPRRVDPTLTGTIGDDVTFFGFPVPPGELRSHWVVLEEPPAGYRFTHDPADSQPNAAEYAYKRFARPVRVLIGPLL